MSLLDRVIIACLLPRCTWTWLYNYSSCFCIIIISIIRIIIISIRIVSFCLSCFALARVLIVAASSLQAITSIFTGYPSAANCP